MAREHWRKRQTPIPGANQLLIAIHRSFGHSGCGGRGSAHEEVLIPIQRPYRMLSDALDNLRGKKGLKLMKSRSSLVLPLLACGALIPVPASAAPKTAPAKVQVTPLEGLKYRLVGPFRGGRATGVSGVPGDPDTFYFGAASGGLWKTTDGGVTWKPLWDKFPEASPAVGAVAVAPSDPKILYVGTGEINIRGNLVVGNGLYKSIDAGKTWTFSGLRDTQVIGRIIVDPKDPNRLFVAALGHPFGATRSAGSFARA